MATTTNSDSAPTADHHSQPTTKPTQHQLLLQGKRLLCVVTGASRGIGREFVVQLGKMAGVGSSLLVVARDSDALRKTAMDAKAVSTEALFIDTLTLDLSKFDDHKTAFETSLQNILRRTTENYDVALLIHNAANLGPVDRSVDCIDDAKQIRNYFELNFVSFVLLNNLFLKTVNDKHAAQHVVVVNVTSIAAVQGLSGFGLYSAGKAARDSFMRSLAADKPEIRVLNYSPGPVATDMLETLVQECWNEKTKSMCREWSENFKVLTCPETVLRLLKILNDNKFENGTRIDYFDSAGD